MNAMDMAFIFLSPILWFGYTTMLGSTIGALMGFAAMFATVYAFLSLVYWLASGR